MPGSPDSSTACLDPPLASANAPSSAARSEPLPTYATGGTERSTAGSGQRADNAVSCGSGAHDTEKA